MLALGSGPGIAVVGGAFAFEPTWSEMAEGMPDALDHARATAAFDRTFRMGRS